MLFSPKNIKDFIEDLKMLIDLHYDAHFRLTQQSDTADGVKKQFIEIKGSNDTVGVTFKSFLEVNCHFSE